MSGIVSSIKPDAIAQKQQDDFIDKTWQSYIDEGFEEGIPHSVRAPHERLITFLQAAGDHPIDKRIMRMECVRNKSKLWLVVYYHLESTDWLGRPLLYAEWVEGYHKVQTRVPQVDPQKKTITQYVRGQEKQEWTIEFTKANVDKAIKQAVNSDREGIKFHIRFPEGPQKDYFSYSQFVNNTWDQNMELLLGNGSPRFNKTIPTSTPSVAVQT